MGLSWAAMAGHDEVRYELNDRGPIMTVPRLLALLVAGAVAYTSPDAAEGTLQEAPASQAESQQAESQQAEAPSPEP